MTVVKICGLTNVADACNAAEAGADMLGFILYTGSARCVSAEGCAAIVRAIRESFGAGAPRCVGVFVNEAPERVRAVLDAAGLDAAQLHGDEPPQQVALLGGRAFKAIRPSGAEQARSMAAAHAQGAPVDGLPGLLVDAYHPTQYGGTGLTVDPALVQPLVGRFRVLLAGGLDPDNVAAAIAGVRPWGVDVAGGVERGKGIKDHGRVRAFVRAVHDLDRQIQEAGVG